MCGALGALLLFTLVNLALNLRLYGELEGLTASRYASGFPYESRKTTTEALVGPILEQGSGLRAGTDFHLGYSPERIDPGNPTWTFENTPKVVSGVDDASLDVVRWFYDQLVEVTVPTPTPKEAELTKLLENTFRHVNIALVNELAMFARDLDIDIWAAIDAASTKPFGYLRFTPGPGAS